MSTFLRGHGGLEATARNSNTYSVEPHCGLRRHTPTPTKATWLHMWCWCESLGLTSSASHTAGSQREAASFNSLPHWWETARIVIITQHAGWQLYCHGMFACVVSGCFWSYGAERLASLSVKRKQLPRMSTRILVPHQASHPEEAFCHCSSGNSTMDFLWISRIWPNMSLYTT